MRKLASIRKINLVEPIEGADAIEVATVDGWKVVVKKNEFKVGDLVVYFEIDSWVPTGLAPFLSKGKEPREYNGIKGERLRTIKLRGQISQGLILPYAICGKICEEGEDVSELLYIQKYEAPIPAQLAGQVKSTFPSFIPKTDQERVQNIPDLLSGRYADEEFEVYYEHGVNISIDVFDPITETLLPSQVIRVSYTCNMLELYQRAAKLINSTSTNISILIRRSEDDGGSPITGYKLFVDAGNNFNSEFSQVLSYIDSGSTHTTLDSDNL
jgi:hypothetical protein